jgi:hypothetical protein
MARSDRGASRTRIHTLQVRRYSITVPIALAIRLAAALLATGLLAWRVVAAMFDRERLVTGRPR